MRIREIIPETWWNDLDPGFLSMMGYAEATQEEEIDTDLANDVATDVMKIRQAH